jgi:hypothetical protein
MHWNQQLLELIQVNVSQQLLRQKQQPFCRISKKKMSWEATKKNEHFGQIMNIQVEVEFHY